MYATGTLILYGRTGVCRVEGIAERALSGRKGTAPYYLMRPLYQDGTIGAPVEKMEDGTIFSRPIMNREQAQALIRALPSLSAEPYHNQNMNQLKEHYRQQLSSFSCRDMARLLSSIYAKKQEAEGRKRKLGAVDQRFMEETEALLYGELAAALEIDRAEVPSYIASTLGRQ